MKITYVVHQFLPRYFTGTEQYVFAVGQWMLTQGHDVDVFTLEPQFAELDPLYAEERDEIDGLPITRVRYWQHLHADRERLEYQHPYLGNRFGRHLDRRRPDVVHFFHLRFLGGNLLDETRARGVPSVVHLMDFWFLCPRVTLVRSDGRFCDGPPRQGLGCVPCAAPEVAAAVEAVGVAEHVAAIHGRGTAPIGKPGGEPAQRAATLLQRPRYLRQRLLTADRIVAPSRFLHGVFVANGFDGARIEVIPYGVDVRGRGAARPARPLTLGFVGSIAPHKGLHVLLEAVSRVDGELRLAVHGRTDDFPEYAQPLLGRAKTDARISFHGAFTADERDRVFAAIDVLVVPSQWYENTPFVALEALAAGVPVLAADLGGLAEIVDDERNGERFVHDDVDDLARRILRLRDEPHRLARYRAGIGVVRTLAESARDIETLYRSLPAARA